MSFTSILGSIDLIDENFVIHGWALFKDNPSLKLDINIVSNDKIIAIGKADKYREDLEKNSIGDAKHGFSIPLPSNLKPSTYIEVIVANLDEPLGSKIAVPDFTELQKQKKEKILEKEKEKKQKEKKTIELLKKFILDSGQFDEKYYKNKYKDAKKSRLLPITHFVKYGLKENKNPNTEFDSEFYLEHYKDIKKAKKINIPNIGIFDMNPFLHYLVLGEKELRFQSKMEFDSYNVIKSLKLFNEDFYYIQDKSVKEQNIDPILHYVKYGYKESKKPNIFFDPTWYKEYYIDIKKSHIEPFYHFLIQGKNEKRFQCEKEMKTFNEIKKSNDFNTDFYLLQLYQEYIHKIVNNEEDSSYVIDFIKNDYNSIIDPILHFIRHNKLENLSLYKNNHKKNEGEIEKIIFDNVIDEFIEYKKNTLLKSKLKTIAFYLPQFHPFPENDLWWGKGFTEWTNVTKAKPNYLGHYQPHLPVHLGFYDLRIPEVMIEQAKLAKNYGIYGFNFYYYWFDGKILMHKPYEILLKHKDIDINFCITWANENWSRRWDGNDNDVLIAQNHSNEDSIKFIKSLYKYFRDDRYIRVDNKPVLIIYRVDIIPNIEETVNIWREEIKKAGFEDIYLICAQTFGIKSPVLYGFDAAMEFPPHTVQSSEVTKKFQLLNSDFDGKIFDYYEVVNNAVKIEEPNYKLYRTAMLSWDNTARKQNSSHIFENFSLLNYKQWISNIAVNMYNNNKYNDNEKFLFINAWNEWAEGTHLEPDRKYGYGYLKNTYDVLSNFADKYNSVLNKKYEKTTDIAVIIHIHYTDIWDYIHKYLKNLKSHKFDLYISITNTENNIIEKIIKEYPNVKLRIFENRGRDILPFINIYKEIKNLNYSCICKIHSKKSVYREDGNILRDKIYNSLLGNKKIIKSILKKFEDDKSIGLITNSDLLIKHNNHNMTYDKMIVEKISKQLGVNFKYSIFPAGSMFWFSPDALNGLEKIKDEEFDIENGLTDGTSAHAIERLFCSIINHNGYNVKGV